jgi:hypothetical protein
MSATEFTSAKTEITAAIADVLEVHPSLVTVAVKATTRRHLATGESVVLEAKVFVTPAAAVAMEAKVTAVQASPAALATKVSAAAGPSVSCSASVANPTQAAGQTPPTPAPTISPGSGPEEELDANCAPGKAPGGQSACVALSSALLLLFA